MTLPKKERNSMGNLSVLGGKANELLSLGNTSSGKPKMLPMDKVKSRVQSRKRFRHIDRLASTIDKSGLHQPIVVYRDGDDYIIQNGERRYRAFKLLNKDEIPAVITDMKEGQDLTTAELLENIQRDDLTPFELSGAIKQYSDDGMTQADIAVELGRSQTWVSTHISLASAPDAVRELYEAEYISDADTLDVMRKIFDIAKDRFELLKMKAQNEGITRSEAKKALVEAKAGASLPDTAKLKPKEPIDLPGWFNDLGDIVKAINNRSDLQIKNKFDEKTGLGLAQFTYDINGPDSFEESALAFLDALRRVNEERIKN
jgi:ParB/RepB/Spo0J family partition protein